VLGFLLVVCSLTSLSSQAEVTPCHCWCQCDFIVQSRIMRQQVSLQPRPPIWCRKSCFTETHRIRLNVHWVTQDTPAIFLQRVCCCMRITSNLMYDATLRSGLVQWLCSYRQRICFLVASCKLTECSWRRVPTSLGIGFILWQILS
jgi:hypothetical protein